MKRTGPRVLLVVLFGLPLLFTVVLTASRLGDQARFVTWPVVAFAVLAAAVTVLGVWTGSQKLSTLAIGLLPAMVISYVLPAVPFPLVAVVLVAMAVLAVTAKGVACGIAAGTGALMTLFVVLQGPAVKCGESSVSTNSGPWWIDEPSRSTSSGSSTADAGSSRANGTIQVGDRHYRYECDNGQLAGFESSIPNE